MNLYELVGTIGYLWSSIGAILALGSLRSVLDYRRRKAYFFQAACVSCGHSRKFCNMDSRCPECGTPNSRALIEAALRRSRRISLAMSAGMLACLPLIIGSGWTEQLIATRISDEVLLDLARPSSPLAAATKETLRDEVLGRAANDVISETGALALWKEVVVFYINNGGVVTFQHPVADVSGPKIGILPPDWPTALAAGASRTVVLRDSAGKEIGRRPVHVNKLRRFMRPNSPMFQPEEIPIPHYVEWPSSLVPGEKLSVRLENEFGAVLWESNVIAP